MEIGGILTVEKLEDSKLLTGDKLGTAKVFRVQTRDNLCAEVEQRDFTDGSKEIRLTEFLSPPPPKYDHLNRNGAMTIQVQADGSYVVLLRALRLGGKDYPTLNDVTWDELSEITELDFQKYLLGCGSRDTEIESYLTPGNLVQSKTFTTSSRNSCG
jgi:hypothetical protein